MLKFSYFVDVLLVLSLLMVSLSVCHTQPYPRWDISILDKSGKLLSNTHAGGLKAPQFSSMDFNGDGVKDLFVFDRNADLVLPFVKTGIEGTIDYRFAPEYISDFPKMIKWALIRDYNNDGIPDIFTCYDNPIIAGNAIAVYKGSLTPNGRLSFELIDPPNVRFRNVLNYQTSSGTYNSIFVNTIDLPSIIDIDGDGDLDIVSFDSGGQYATFYKNVSLEENLGIEAFKYVIADPCWGKFQEAQFNDALTLSDNPTDCALGFHPGDNSDNRHSGTALCILDLNGDFLYDMIIGDIGSSRMTGLINGGTPNNAHIVEKQIDFPSANQKAQISDFVAAYHLDVDGDNVRDLIATTNAINGSENINHIWYYKNEGTDSRPEFNLIKKDFLIDDMPYFYSGAHPVFSDINNDGLIDIIIGTNGIIDPSKERQNRMVFLKNIGTKSNPQYQIEDEDYLSFSQFRTFGVGRLAPTFGDLNGDGSPDLLVGTLQEAFLYSENLAPSSAPYKFDIIQGTFPYRNQSTPLFLIQNIKPQIFDTDGDGLSDIIVGKANRQLNLFVNTGTESNPFFNMDNLQSPNQVDFGNILRSQKETHANASPHFFRSIEDDFMLLGTDNANLELYKLGQIPYPDTFTLISRHLGEISEGRNTVASMADIDADGLYEIVVGNERGGIAFYKTPLAIGKTSASHEAADSQSLKIFPNPTSSFVYIQSEKEFSTALLLDVYGRTIKKIPLNEDIALDDLPVGIYFIKLDSGKSSVVEKLSIVR